MLIESGLKFFEVRNDTFNAHRICISQQPASKRWKPSAVNHTHINRTGGLNHAFFKTAGRFVNHDVEQAFEYDVIVERKHCVTTHVLYVAADRFVFA